MARCPLENPLLRAYGLADHRNILGGYLAFGVSTAWLYVLGRYWQWTIWGLWSVAYQMNLLS